ncbi:MAG: thioesterase family protein [Jatrophihabitans sp.]|uniref:thioesterase family protein n=1 Tax=Jatrophihabitans sp. TaxID=1932789 RepID=UPI00390E6E8C
MPPVAFSDVTALTPDGPARFTVDVHPEWTIAGKPNGGYLTGLLGRAAAAVGPHEHPIAASAHFLRSPEPGPAVVSAELLRGGRSASQLRVQLRQDDQLCIEALVTTSVLDPAAKPYWADGAPAAGTASLEDSIRLPSLNPLGVKVAIMDQVDLRIEPDSFGFGRGEPSGRGELRGWLALPHGEAFDPFSLIYAVDAFPPATFDIELTGWVPTLELTAYVRAIPAPGPVRVLQKAQLIEGQRVDEACWVWDSTGRLVASGTQLAGIRLG